MVEPSGTARSGETTRVGGIREVPRPPGERSSEEKRKRGEDGASNELRTAMAGMEVGRDDMEEGEGEEVEQDDAEAEEGGLGDSGTGIYRAPDSG